MEPPTTEQFICRLPADVLIHTLSFLPLPCLVRTLRLCRIVHTVSVRPEFWHVVALSHFPPFLLPMAQEEEFDWFETCQSLWQTCGSEDTSPIVLFSDRSFSTSSKMYYFRCLLCGRYRSGKTSLFERFLLDQFNLASTVAMDPPMKVFKLSDSEETDVVVGVELWDSAGCGDLRDSYMHHMFYRSADLFYLCFKCNDRTSLMRVGGFLAYFDLMNTVRQDIGLKVCIRPERIVFVACQCDLINGNAREKLRKQLWTDVLVPLAEDGFTAFGRSCGQLPLPVPGPVGRTHREERDHVFEKSSNLASSIIQLARKMAEMNGNGEPEDCLTFFSTSAKDSFGVDDAFVGRPRAIVRRALKMNLRWPATQIRGVETDEVEEEVDPEVRRKRCSVM